MTKKKTRLHQNIYDYKGADKETNKGESLTVPGEAYTIPELYERSQAGIPLETSVNVHPDTFGTDADFDTFVPEADFDISEAAQMGQEAHNLIEQAKLKLDESEDDNKTPSQETKASETEAKVTPEGNNITSDDKSQK